MGAAVAEKGCVVGFPAGKQVDARAEGCFGHRHAFFLCCLSLLYPLQVGPLFERAGYDFLQ